MWSVSGFGGVIAMMVLSALCFAAALRFRSWPLWLVAFATAIGALGAAWWFRANVAPT